MRMKPREVEKHELAQRPGAFALPGISALCGGNVGGIRIFGQTTTAGTGEIYIVVVPAVPVGGNRNRLGDVPVF